MTSLATVFTPLEQGIGKQLITTLAVTIWRSAAICFFFCFFFTNAAQPGWRRHGKWNAHIETDHYPTFYTYIWTKTVIQEIWLLLWHTSHSHTSPDRCCAAAAAAAAHLCNDCCGENVPCCHARTHLATGNSHWPPGVSKVGLSTWLLFLSVS